MKKIKYSIIIPMYNESKYVGRCLESLLQQTFQDYEIIMIDDGSNDNTVNIVKGYVDKFSSLTLLQQNRGGPGKARNRGASFAKGAILIFVDADMMFDQYYIEKLIEPIVQGKEIGTAHGREYVANKENKIARAFSLIRSHYNPKQIRGGVFRAIRKDKFIESGGFDDSKGYTDDDLSKKLGKSLIVPGPIAYHNNPESFSEIYHHSQWVGKSLRSSGEIIHYLKKYQWRLIVFLIGSIVIFYIIGITKGLLGGMILGFLLIVAKALQRAISEKYLSHIVYVPVVMVVRGAGYLTGIINNLFTKSIY